VDIEAFQPVRQLLEEVCTRLIWQRNTSKGQRAQRRAAEEGKHQPRCLDGRDSCVAVGVCCLDTQARQRRTLAHQPRDDATNLRRAQRHGGGAVEAERRQLQLLRHARHIILEVFLKLWTIEKELLQPRDLERVDCRAAVGLDDLEALEPARRVERREIENLAVGALHHQRCHPRRSRRELEDDRIRVLRLVAGHTQLPQLLQTRCDSQELAPPPRCLRLRYRQLLQLDHLGHHLCGDDVDAVLDEGAKRGHRALDEREETGAALGVADFSPLVRERNLLEEVGRPRRARREDTRRQRNILDGHQEVHGLAHATADLTQVHAVLLHEKVSDALEDSRLIKRRRRTRAKRCYSPRTACAWRRSRDLRRLGHRSAARSNRRPATTSTRGQSYLESMPRSCGRRGRRLRTPEDTTHQRCLPRVEEAANRLLGACGAPAARLRRLPQLRAVEVAAPSRAARRTVEAGNERHLGVCQKEGGLYTPHKK
jgi:hypothetical protein